MGGGGGGGAGGGGTRVYAELFSRSFHLYLFSPADLADIQAAKTRKSYGQRAK